MITRALEKPKMGMEHLFGRFYKSDVGIFKISIFGPKWRPFMRKNGQNMKNHVFFILTAAILGQKMKILKIPAPLL